MSELEASPEIGKLIAELDSEDTNAAEEARHGLVAHRQAVLEQLMAAAPHFGRFGQLSAIELFEAIGDRRAGPVLIAMLRSEHDTVREWAADALGRLGVVEAVPELQRAYEATKRSGTPPDWTEPTAMRSALTALGAREEVVPLAVAELAMEEETVGRCWLPTDLPAVIRSLAEANQVVLFFMFWTRWSDMRTWHETPGWELDWSASWSELVESARRRALDAARRADTPDETVVTVTWLDEKDR